MNILPKKKWHVRTRENISRVRRDEAKAAEEEQQRLDRAIKAENERRLDALRGQAEKRNANLVPFTLRGSAEGDASISAASGHVNLFQDLEAAERNNFGTSNKEYEEEKRKEQAEHDSKWGIQKCFAEGTNELNKVQEWYVKVSRPWVKDDIKEKPNTPAAAPPPMEKPLEGKEKVKEHKKRKRSESSSSSSEWSSGSGRKKKKRGKEKEKKKKRKHKKHRVDPDDESRLKTELELEKRNKLAALREERIRRERAERHRTQQLLNPSKAPVVKQKYNSMFNPDLCRK